MRVFEKRVHIVKEPGDSGDYTPGCKSKQYI